MAKRLYLAYGSNINIEQMSHRCPGAKIYGTTCLKNYELVFRGHRESGVANVEPSRGGCVPVVVWEITPKDENALDVYEGFPRLYIKQDFEIQINGKRHSAMAYVMTNGHPYGVPSSMYLQTIIDGYLNFDFDTTPLMESAARERGRIGKLQTDGLTESFAALLDIADRQKYDESIVCPRCGMPHMNEPISTNALSRRANVYICGACGNDEAMRDFLGLYDAVQDWDAVKKQTKAR